MSTNVEPMRVIEAGHLLLEPQGAVHADEMFVVLSDPAIYEYENGPPSSLEWLRDRYTKLESRQSKDGTEQWLNWVIRLQSGELIGYVQATVREGGSAAIAYELASAHWGRGHAFAATHAMIAELNRHYGVTRLSAVLKRQNFRSQRLLERLGFELASPEEFARHSVDDDEMLMLRNLAPA